MPEETTAVAEAPSAGAGAAPATSVTETAPVPGTGAETRETALPTGATEETQQAPPTEEPSQPEGDTRVIPLKWRELLSKDRELRNLFFRDHELQREVPGGIPEVRKMKEALELAGGPQGIAQMQTDLSDFKTVAQQFVDGNPEFAEGLFKEDPLVAAGHTAEFLKQMRTADEPGYNRLIARRFAEEFQATGIRQMIDRAYALTDNQEAKQLLERMAGWHDAVVQVSKQEDDPRFKQLQAQLKKERAERANTDTQTFVSGYRQEAGNQVTASANKLLDDYLQNAPATHKPDADDRKRLLTTIIQEANASLESKEEFKKQRDSLIGRRDSKSAVRFVTSRWEEELKKSVASVMKTYGKGWTKSAPAPTNGQQPKPPVAAAPAGFTPIAKRSDIYNQIDWAKTTGAMVLQERKAILRDGKKVTWAALE